MYGRYQSSAGVVFSEEVNYNPSSRYKNIAECMQDFKAKIETYFACRRNNTDPVIQKRKDYFNENIIPKITAYQEDPSDANKTALVQAMDAFRDTKICFGFMGKVTTISNMMFEWGWQISQQRCNPSTRAVAIPASSSESVGRSFAPGGLGHSGR